MLEWRPGIRNLLLFLESKWSRPWKMAAWAARSTTHHRAKAKRKEKSAPSVESVSDLGSVRFQLMTLQLNLCNDKIPKKQFNHRHLSAKKHRQGKNLWKRKKKNSWHNVRLSIEVMAALTWISPGCVWRFVQALSWDHKRLFFNISWVPTRQVCWNPTGGNTLSLSGPESHTKEVPQSHKFMERQLFLTSW